MAKWSTCTAPSFINITTGSIVSHKKEDLVVILDHWNIQVDNPVSLLDQDTSRHFLHSNNPGHKYKVRQSVVCENWVLCGRCIYIVVNLNIDLARLAD